MLVIGLSHNLIKQVNRLIRQVTRLIEQVTMLINTGNYARQIGNSAYQTGNYDYQTGNYYARHWIRSQSCHQTGNCSYQTGRLLCNTGSDKHIQQLCSTQYPCNPWLASTSSFFWSFEQKSP